MNYVKQNKIEFYLIFYTMLLELINIKKAQTQTKAFNKFQHQIVKV